MGAETPGTCDVVEGLEGVEGALARYRARVYSCSLALRAGYDLGVGGVGGGVAGESIAGAPLGDTGG